MIIRNGFIRSDHGVWFNLNLVRSVYVDTIYTKDEPQTYCVMAKMLNKDEDEVRLSLLYDEEDHAMCMLDDVFGYEE